MEGSEGTRARHSDSDTDADGSRTAHSANSKRFVKPTFEELKLHAAKIGLPCSEAEKFWNHYEANGWKVGRNPMKSWPHALVNWRKNWQEWGRQGSPPGRQDQPRDVWSITPQETT
jgi:hypothetical protein